MGIPPHDHWYLRILHPVLASIRAGVRISRSSFKYIFKQSEKSIRVFLSGIIYQHLPSSDGIALPVNSINDRHDASIFCKIHVLFR